MSMFGWCASNKHDKCIRRYQRFYVETRKNKNYVVYLDEFRECQCLTRGCACYTKVKDRTKKKTRRKS